MALNRTLASKRSPKLAEILSFIFNAYDDDIPTDMFSLNP